MSQVEPEITIQEHEVGSSSVYYQIFMRKIGKFPSVNLENKGPSVIYKKYPWNDLSSAEFIFFDQRLAEEYCMQRNAAAPVYNKGWEYKVFKVTRIVEELK